MFLQQFIIATVVVLILDAIWIGVNIKSYQQLTETIQGTKMMVKWIPAILTYGLILLGLYLILLYAQYESSKPKVILYAFLFGIVSYGIYNFTNLAILTNYTTPVAIKDTLWGGVLLATSIGIAIYVSKK